MPAWSEIPTVDVGDDCFPDADPWWNTYLAQAVNLGVVSPPLARLHRSTSQTITDSAVTPISFDTSDDLTDLTWATSPNPTRVVVATPGWYVIQAGAVFAANATGQRHARLRVGGATDIARRVKNAKGGGVATAIDVWAIYELSASDYVEFTVVQTSGGNLSATFVADRGNTIRMARL